MAEITDLEYVREILIGHDQAQYGDFIHELQYESAGTVLDDIEGLPDGWVIKLHEVQSERDYDSYGNSYTEDAYVILSVSEGTNEVLYKIPGSYASYEGWNWEIYKLARVEKREKVITAWEWTNV